MHFDLPEPIGRTALGICMGEELRSRSDSIS
jgi:hypothetical protein